MRTLPAGLTNLLKSGFAETHSWLVLTTPGTNDPSLTYRLATASITINGVPYQPSLRTTGAVKLSLTRAADRVDVEIENASEIFGPQFLRDRDKITGASVAFGRYWQDLDNSGNAYSKQLLTGAVSGVRVTRDAIQLTLVSDMYSTGSIGGNRLVGRRCQWTFRDANTCAYTGAELTCNKRHTDADGCSGRSNTHRFGGFIYIDPAASVTTGAGLSGPPANQLVKSTTGDSFLQRQFLSFTPEFGISDDAVNEQTEITITGWFNVKAYGATGDGSTNDTTAVQAAIDAAAAAGGGVVYFPPGTYNVDTLDLSTAIGIIVQGAGIGVSILECRTANTPIIEVTGANAHDITIRDIELNGDGPSSGSSGHGIYFHSNGFDTYNLHLDNVRVLDCGGHGVFIDGQFTNNFNKVFVSNCGGNAFDISGGNTVMLSNCYVDDIADAKVGYRVHAGQLTMLNCNGLDSLGSTSDWAVLGDTTADDGQDRYCDAVLIGCNVEAFKRYGVYAKTGSRASFQGCFFTTSASGSSHVAIKIHYTASEPGILDSECRFNVQGTATWANSMPIHGTDIPVVQIGHRKQQYYYNTSSATNVELPCVSGTSIASQPQLFIPKLATDQLKFATDNVGDIGATGANRPRDAYIARDILLGRNLTVSNGGQITQAGTVAGFLGAQTINSDTSASSNAGYVAVNDVGKNAFVKVFADATSIAQVGSDHYVVYLKVKGNNRWYWDSAVYGPLADNQSDIGDNSTRVRAAYAYDFDLKRTLIARGTTPSVNAGTGAGTSPTLTISDTPTACYIDLTTGTSPATSAKVFDVTLGTTAPNYYQAWLQPANAAAAALSGTAQVFVDDAAAANNKVTINVGAGGLAASTQYLWYVFIIAV